MPCDAVYIIRLCAEIRNPDLLNKNQGSYKLQHKVTSVLNASSVNETWNNFFRHTN